MRIAAALEYELSELGWIEDGSETVSASFDVDC